MDQGRMKKKKREKTAGLDHKRKKSFHKNPKKHHIKKMREIKVRKKIAKWCLSQSNPDSITRPSIKIRNNIISDKKECPFFSFGEQVSKLFYFCSQKSIWENDRGVQGKKKKKLSSE